MNWLPRLGLAAVASGALLTACLDFDNFVVPPPANDVCPTALPTDVCVAPATDFTESGPSELQFTLFPVKFKTCDDGHKCLLVEAIPNARAEAASRATAALGNACIASLAVAEAAVDAWTYLALVSDSVRIEVAFRPGKARLSIGNDVVEVAVDDAAIIDTLRIHHTGGDLALEALDGETSVACFTATSESLLAGDFEVRFGIDAGDDPEASGSSLFDAYGLAPTE